VEVVLPACTEIASSGNPIKYIFDLNELKRRALKRILLASDIGANHPLSLDECKTILVEAIPLLERIRLQCGEESGLVVQVVFVNGVPTAGAARRAD
jgi:hypothetical protein